jgi:hypothetical protein
VTPHTGYDTTSCIRDGFNEIAFPSLLRLSLLQLFEPLCHWVHGILYGGLHYKVDLLYATTSHPEIRPALEFLSRSFLLGNFWYFRLLSWPRPMSSLGHTRALNRDSHKSQEITVDIVDKQWTELPPFFMLASLFACHECFFLSVTFWQGWLGTLHLCQGISSICCTQTPGGNLSV